MYDIIGDIHGHYGELHTLLTAMGYAYDEAAHVFTHPTRKVLFIGDYIDGGPENLKCVSLVRHMVDAGAAIALMGNHEFNAVMYATPKLDGSGFMRPRGGNNEKQHAAFLREVEHDAALYADVIGWFKTLPVFSIQDSLHLVHACWDADAIATLQDSGAMRANGTLTAEGWLRGGDKATQEYRLLEILLKGPEEELGHGFKFSDAHGITRKKGRIKWWNEHPATYLDAFGIPAQASFAHEAYQPSAANAYSAHLREGLKKVAMVVFGHYWMRGERPMPLSDHVACVDWSVAKSGMLVAYRHDGESKFLPQNFVSVPSLQI